MIRRVAFTDHEIGRLVEGLQERGRWDESVVVFSADHGENMGEDGLYFAHGPSLADASLRVPLIIAGPTIPAGVFDGGIALIEDVMPTLLDLAAIPAELQPEMDGGSLQWRWNPDLEYPGEVATLAVAEAGGALHPDTANYVVSGRERSKYCYNSERYSMCFDPKDAKARRVNLSPGEEDEDEEDEEDEPQAVRLPPRAEASQTPTLEFFDRSTDPLMKRALSEVPQEVKDELEAARKRWSPESTRLRAVRDPSYKLVAYPLLAGGYRYALYDLRADPHERRDVSEENPRVFRRMLAALDDWGNTMPKFVARERSESEVDELRALGYVQ